MDNSGVFGNNFDINNNPYMLYLMMQHQNRQHLFNQMVGYNPFFLQDQSAGYNEVGNVRYLMPQFAAYDYNMKDLFLTSLLGLKNLKINEKPLSIHLSGFDVLQCWVC